MFAGRVCCLYVCHRRESPSSHLPRSAYLLLQNILSANCCSSNETALILSQNSFKVTSCCLSPTNSLCVLACSLLQGSLRLLRCCFARPLLLIYLAIYTDCLSNLLNYSDIVGTQRPNLASRCQMFLDQRIRKIDAKVVLSVVFLTLAPQRK